ncbi:hypothetical protein HDU79_004200 [Rhizoclosmatium sp. JEL0117]|nr:hypothetical protein HDU79_004200 [Rhizoclosmatium sp. JEL0117]
MDANQHINNTKYLSYVGTAQVQYLETIRSQQKDDSMASMISIVKKHVVQYKFPVTYPDKVSIGVKADPKSIKAGQLDLICMIVSHKHKMVVCEVRTLLVAFDLRTNRKANMSPEFLRVLEQWEQCVDSDWKLAAEEKAQL